MEMGNDIREYTLSNAEGMTVRILNYGGTIKNIMAPGGNGKMEDVVLGFDTPEEYTQKENPYFGCITGRYANRISKGRFTLEGQEYRLPKNNGNNTLHGGDEGFNRKIWHAEPFQQSLKLSYLSADGEEGFPGNLLTEVVYSLNDDNELKIAYTASADMTTVLNLTNHSYFNLAPHDPTVEAHEICLHAAKYVEVDDEYIPTGKLADVSGTLMDFSRPALIGKDLHRIPGGFDHTWVLDKKDAESPQLAASIFHPVSRRYMEVFTTQPGIQFYSGNFLDGTLKGKNGLSYIQHAGLCLETQHFPDSPNQPSFPDTVLRPGETFTQTTIYKFTVK